jgi:hypothetical protein
MNVSSGKTLDDYETLHAEGEHAKFVRRLTQWPWMNAKPSEPVFLRSRQGAPLCLCGRGLADRKRGNDAWRCADCLGDTDWMSR